MNTLVIIPSRLSATRLPGKPLLKINGLSIISHVFRKAEEANIGEVLVATEDQEIMDDVKKNGGQAILTKSQHKTGTDRIYEALKKIDNSKIDLVMNLQGDEPLMNIEDIKNLNNQMEMNYTLVAESEADLKTGKISVNSPIGKGLLGKKVGEIAEINVPNGTLKFEILSINR